MNAYFVIYDQFVNIVSDNDYGIEKEQITEPEEVIEGMKDQFIDNLKEGLIRATEYTYEIKSRETITINGWEMCKYTGAIKLTHDSPLDYESAAFVAYGLIKDGYPVYFAVVEKPDGKNPIDIEAMADKIARTFREYTDE